MRWPREEHKAKAAFYWVGTILIILVIIFMLADFISWKSAIGMIKKEIPIDSQVVLYDGGGGTDVTSYLHSMFRWKGKLKGEMWFFTDKDFNIDTRKIDWNRDGIHTSSIGRFQFGMKDYNIPIIYPENMEIHTLIYTSEKYLDENRVVCYKKVPHNFDIWVYIINKGELKQFNNLQGTYYRKDAVLGFIYRIDNQVYIQVHQNAYWRYCKGGGFYWSFWRH